MTTAVKIVIALAAVGLIWLGWRELGLLSGTWLNDVRLVLLVAAVFLVLTAAERLSARVEAALSRRDRSRQ